MTNQEELNKLVYQQNMKGCVWLLKSSEVLA